MRRRSAACSLAAGLLSAAILLGAALADAELTQRGDLFVSFSGGITPNALPRDALASVAVHVEGVIRTLDAAKPPPLRRIAIAINRAGRLDSAGLPSCPRSRIEFTTTRAALATCRSALIGQGSFAANVSLGEQPSFPSRGHLLAFNATRHGRPIVLAHIYGTQPVPLTRLLTFTIRHTPGTYGTTLTMTLSRGAANRGSLKRIDLTLQRRFTYRGAPRSYLSAACSAPPGFPAAVFPFARATMSFPGAKTLTATLIRSCRVRK